MKHIVRKAEKKNQLRRFKLKWEDKFEMNPEERKLGKRDEFIWLRRGKSERLFWKHYKNYSDLLERVCMSWADKIIVLSRRVYSMQLVISHAMWSAALYVSAGVPIFRPVEAINVCGGLLWTCSSHDAVFLTHPNLRPERTRGKTSTLPS
jgi:hypothetical protein